MVTFGCLDKKKKLLVNHWNIDLDRQTDGHTDTGVLLEKVKMGLMRKCRVTFIKCSSQPDDGEEDRLATPCCKTEKQRNTEMVPMGRFRGASRTACWGCGSIVLVLT